MECASCAKLAQPFRRLSQLIAWQNVGEERILFLNDLEFAALEPKAMPSEHNIEAFEQRDELRHRQFDFYLPHRNSAWGRSKLLLDIVIVHTLEQECPNIQKAKLVATAVSNK